MIFNDLLKKQGYAGIARQIGITRGDLWTQTNLRGFSASTIKKLSDNYGRLDIKDLVNKYPRTKDGKNESNDC